MNTPGIDPESLLAEAVTSLARVYPEKDTSRAGDFLTTLQRVASAAMPNANRSVDDALRVVREAITQRLPQVLGPDRDALLRQISDRFPRGKPRGVGWVKHSGEY